MGSYDIKIEYFDNIYRFLDTIGKRPNNAIMKYEHSSHIKGEESWYGTNSYEEAEELLAKGWDAGAAELKGLTKGIKIPQSVIKKNVKGFFPSVPDALTGKPKAMYDKKKERRQSNTLNVFVSPVATCDKTKEIIKVGAIAIDIVNAIESAGIRCNLYSCPMMSDKNMEIIGCAIKIKDAQQPLNLKKVAYPLGHISFFRRHGFKYLETAPGVTQGFHIGYGTSIWQNGKYSRKVIEAKEKIQETLKDVIHINYNVCNDNDWDSQKVLEDLINNSIPELKERMEKEYKDG